MNEEQMKAIIGGIFGTGTYTEFTADGEAVEKKEKFNIRLYKDLWLSGAIKKLKGNKLSVWLTIAIHANNSGEGWPSQRTIASLLGLNKDTVTKALIALEEDGFIERTKAERDNETGKFANTRYKIKFAPETRPKKSDREKLSEKAVSDPSEKTGQVILSEKTSTGKTSTGKTGHKNTNLLEDPFTKKSSKYVGSYPNPDIQETVVDQYVKNFKLSNYAKKKLEELVKLYGELLVIESLSRAVQSETDKPIAYMGGVLRKWSAANIQTLEDIQRYEEAHRRSKEERKKPVSKPKNADKLPISVQQQIEQAKKEAAVTQASKMSEEERKEKEAQIRAKLKTMNESLHSWMHQKQNRHS